MFRCLDCGAVAEENLSGFDTNGSPRSQCPECGEEIDLEEAGQGDDESEDPPDDLDTSDEDDFETTAWEREHIINPNCEGCAGPWCPCEGPFENTCCNRADCCGESQGGQRQ